MNDIEWFNARRTWWDVVRCVLGVHRAVSDYGVIKRCSCGAFGPWPWYYLSASEKRERWRR